MASVNEASSLSRTRSGRVPANVGKPFQLQASSRGGTQGVTSSTTAAPPASPTVVSNVSLFLTNLRLLDLDLHPDWPDINTHTFSSSTKDAAQGQKKRIQCVEWALYHLFALWDPAEARSKLQPFFPPLDHLQSLNLRAALLRGLEQAKKNGVLGRDAVVRRTMLDECKGERLEEVLAVLSSAVLKKRIAEQQLLLSEPGHPALAQTLALENRGYSGERSELTALVLAHRVSLRRMLDEKNAARARFREFADLLALKEKAIARRREEAEAAKRSGQEQALSEDEKLELRRTVRNNWTGNERWMETLLYGDAKSRRDGLLSTPFDRVWRRVQAGRLAELDDTSAGLLEQLDSRVRGQQKRLEKWQEFRQRMFGKTASERAVKELEPRPTRKGIDLGFGAHEELHLDRMNSRKLPSAKLGQLDSHYEALIKDLKSELARFGAPVTQVSSCFQRRRQTERPPARRAEPADPEPEPETISDISDLEETQVLPRLSPSRRDPIKVLEQPAFEPVLRKAKTFDDEHAYPDPPTPSRPRRSATIQAHPPSTRSRPSPDCPPSNPNPSQTQPQPPLRPSTPPRLITTSPERSPERPLSPTQQLADQILASVSATSPSPVKRPRHTLSLAERTRLSMARRRTSHHANLGVPDDDEDDNDGPLLQQRLGPPEPDRLSLKRASSSSSSRAAVVAGGGSAAPDGGGVNCGGSGDGGVGAAGLGVEDLAARTRRSMAGFEAARQKAQLERRRSLRKGPPAGAGAGRSSSYFAAVDEESEGNSTLLLAEELMSGEHKDDYEAVFMSRPKLKVSPVGTPVRTPVRELWGE